MGDPQRDLDVVVYGATGFLGKLTAEYLAGLGSGVCVALAGRSADRLQQVRQTLGDGARDWPLIVADLAQPQVLVEMAARARVVLSTVGPYVRYGLPIVAACAAAGTDYVDATGEVPFVRDSIDRYHAQAVDSAARIVHSCGFDSVPSDLTVYALHRRAADDDTGELGDTTMVLRGFAGGLSSGSMATMVELLRVSNDPRIRRLVDDPYSLSPARGAEPDLGPQPDVRVRRGAEIAPELADVWTGGYLMAPYNTRCVRRTNALLDWAYGRRFRYSEALSMGSSPAAAIAAGMSTATIAGATTFGGAYLNLFPRGLVERMMPATGFGFRSKTGGHYRVETYTQTTRGARYVATMSQQADPGYTATAMMLGESTLALVSDRAGLADSHGVLTPVTAMGDVLLKRLPAAGVTIQAVRLD
jgi:short subunit dehydrogenase-like uncharacterized protein